MHEPPMPPPAGADDMIGAWLSQTFRLWTARWPVWVGQSLILAALSAGVSFAALALRQHLGMPLNPEQPTPNDLLLWSGELLATMLIVVLVSPGITLTALRQLRGQPIDVRDLARGVPYFLPVLGMEMLRSLVMGLGLLACCVGYVFVAGYLCLALPFLVDRRVSPMTALLLSVRVAGTRLWHCIGFVFTMYAVTMAPGLLISMSGLAERSPYAYVAVGALLEGVMLTLLLIAGAVAYERAREWLPGVPGATTPWGVPPPYGPAMAQTQRRCRDCRTPLADDLERCPYCGSLDPDGRGRPAE